MRLSDRRVPVIAAAALVDSVGTGFMLALLPVFGVRQLGLSVGQVGLALGAAGLFGLLAPVPAGYLADRFGAGRVWGTVLVARAVCSAGLLLVGSFAPFVALIALSGLLESANGTAQQTFVVRLVGAGRRGGAMATVRAVRNVGLSLGLLGAGALLALGTRVGFQVGFAVNAASYVVMFLAVTAVGPRTRPAVAPDPDSEPNSDVERGADAGPDTDVRPGTDVKPGADVGPRATAGPSPLRDRRYLLFSAGNAVVMLHDSVLFVLLPLWLVTRTSLPAGLVGPMLALNTVLTVLLQAALSRWPGTVPGARRLTVRALVPLSTACALFAMAERVPTGLALVLVVAAVTLLSCGDNLHAVAGFELAHRLAPERTAGRYLGIFNVGVSSQLAFGPPVVTWLAATGSAGWLALAGCFTLGTTALLIGSRVPRSESERHPDQAGDSRRPARDRQPAGG